MHVRAQTRGALRVTSAAMHRLAAVLVILVVGLAPAAVAQAQLGPNAPAPLTSRPATLPQRVRRMV